MALFELESGRLIPAQFGTPVGHGLETDVLESIRSQVLEVIDRPLFPVAWAGTVEQEETTAGPHSLTALDASGQVVSVEVLSRLDPVSLVAAMSRLGQVSGQGWMDLAAQYPGGVQAFQTGWAEFREAMPPTTQPGPRLILVVGEIDQSCYSALGVLFASGLEIHQVSSRQMSNGRRFLEVAQLSSTSMSCVRPQIGGHRAPTPQISWHVDEEVSSSEEPEIALVPPTPPTPPEYPEGSSAESEAVAAAQEEESPLPTGEEDNENQGESLEGEAISEGEAALSEGEAESEEAPGKGAATAEDSESVAIPQLLQKNPEGLRSISTLVGQDAVLLWSDERGRICEALLKQEGVIDPGDGQFTDQVQVAFEQVGGNSQVDGWEAFRIGNLEGPTLAEAIAEVNAEIERNNGMRQGKHGQ
ncbi:hypothetical protein [Varibaculum vaginae]|uniref:hypothetical protein n=1 Tax=Varibaculum vaginae TaxID=2364797 RepID=UPI000F07BFA3|nr:hypothetical protein [Varibaculum vaginae]